MRMGSANFPLSPDSSSNSPLGGGRRGGGGGGALHRHLAVGVPIEGDVDVDEMILVHQRRLVELQQADEERALAVALEMSLRQSEAEEASPSAAEAAAEHEAAVEASTVASLRALPTQTYGAMLSERGSSFADAEPEECALCMEAFVKDDALKVLRCSHFFHGRCIDEWFCVGQQQKARSCPVCATSPLAADAAT